MPKVSVTIPTYNRASLVKEAVESVLAQTLKDFEVIVVDDGSTDNTRDVIEAIKDSRIRYFHRENGGCSSARNTGLRNCGGEYIAFLDSDDLWPNSFLEVMLSHLESKSQYGCVYCPVVKTSSDGGQEDSYGVMDCKSGRITAALFKRSFIWLQAALFSRDALGNLVFDESMRNGADTDALLRLSTRIQFLFVPEIKVIFRTKHGVSPRMDISALNCNRIRVLERFYYLFGGDKFVSASVARRKLSHAYRSVAKNYYKKQCKAASMLLYKQAIRYWPIDFRLYGALICTLLLNGRKDPDPNWKMRSRLPDITL